MNRHFQIKKLSNLGRQVTKATAYISRGDLRGLRQEISAYRRWRRASAPPRSTDQSDILPGPDKSSASPVIGQTSTPPPSHGLSESEYWDEADINLIRHAAWISAGGGAPGRWALDWLCADHEGDVIATLASYLGGLPQTGLRGLVLGCGDMAAEHSMFCHPKLLFDQIDAYDLSPASIERARVVTMAKGLNVTYTTADINQLSLPADTYDLVICFFSYHHFMEVEAIAAQINHSLRPQGVFFTIDYVGEQQQQFSSDQLRYANHFLSLLPPKYRKELNGSLRTIAKPVPVELFSPDEAIRSDQILAALDSQLTLLRQYNWAGLLMPLIEGLGFNFSESEPDLALLRFLFDVDRVLVNSGEIGPNFTMTMAGKRH